MPEIWPKMLAGFSSSRVASLSPRAALAHRRCVRSHEQQRRRVLRLRSVLVLLVLLAPLLPDCSGGSGCCCSSTEELEAAAREVRARLRSCPQAGR